jgi:hypothetical protein
MKKLILTSVAALALAGTAHAKTFHYAYHSGEDRYVLLVNTDRGIVTLTARGPTRKLATFKILKTAPADCAKYGWALNDGAMFCTATQGVADLNWGGKQFDCDQAD